MKVATSLAMWNLALYSAATLHFLVTFALLVPRVAVVFCHSAGPWILKLTERDWKRHVITPYHTILLVLTETDKKLEAISNY